MVDVIGWKIKKDHRESEEASHERNVLIASSEMENDVENAVCSSNSRCRALESVLKPGTTDRYKIPAPPSLKIAKTAESFDFFSSVLCFKRCLAFIYMQESKSKDAQGHIENNNRGRKLIYLPSESVNGLVVWCCHEIIPAIEI